MMRGRWPKIILAVVLVFSFIFLPIYTVKAFSGWLIVLKEYVLDLIARLISRTLLSIMSNGITRVILNSGREGGPAIVQDWRDFLEIAQYRGEDSTRAIIGDAAFGSATLCSYLRSPVAGIFNAGLIPGFDPSKYRIDNLQYYNIRNRCTLPANFNVSAFRNDFRNGGWAAWEQLIQPQNNFYGVYADSNTELSNQRVFEQSIDTSETESGSGYTSRRTGCEVRAGNTQCLVYGKVVTPADLFGKNGAATIDRELDWLVGSDELEEVLVGLTGVVINKLTNFVVNSALNEVGPGLGADSNAAPKDAPTSAQQDCVNACIASNCSPALQQCSYNNDGETINKPCVPEDVDPRDACITTCQAQRCQ